MKDPTPAEKVKRIGSDAVRAKTGKGWDEGLAALDVAGARQLNPKQIVADLAEQHNIGAWWQQMLTVGYEQARGLRAKHQKPDGYSISRNETIPVPPSVAFAAWTERRKRARWLRDGGFEVRKATPGRS